MRWTQEQADAHQARVKSPVDRLFHSSQKAPAKKSKFRNKRCEAADGTKFQSKLERDYYEKLLLRWHAGEVLWFVRQCPFELEGGVKYLADFLIAEALPTFHIRLIDTTGVFTPTKKTKLKQLKARYGLDVEIVTK